MLGAMAITLAGLVAAFVLYRRGADTGAELIETMAAAPGLTIENLRHTAAVEGRTEWTLEAARAKMTADRQSADLEAVAVVFYLEDGDRVRLTADEGFLDIPSNDLELRGNIVVVHGVYRLTTDRMQYRHRQRLLTAGTPVTVASGKVSLTAKTASFDMDSRILRFEGNVNGTIAQNLEL
jgi:LPS export ABC transporter protein LptC